MGTNYYASSPNLGEGIGRYYHVGKSSLGWKFCFRGHPDLGITSFDDWMVVLGDGNCVIRDEYGEDLSSAELLFKICRKMIENGFGGDRRDPVWNVPFTDSEFS